MRWLVTLLLIASLLGGVFRLTHLKGKVYWHDEVYTAMYVTGHGNKEVLDELFNGELKVVADALQMQTATEDRGVKETIRQLATHDAQHPPLYYVLCRLMLYVVPDTVLATRLVAAIAGILLIPATYCLCQQLFAASTSVRLTATLGATLVAVSPFQYLYSQEARQYSLWPLSVAIASIAYFIAIKKNSRLSWLMYTLTLLTSLYTCVLSLLLPISHGLHLLWLTYYRSTLSQKFNRAILTHFTTSVGVSLLLFIPWLQFISSAHIKNVSWTALPISFHVLMRSWTHNLTHLFIDFNLAQSFETSTSFPFTLLKGVVISFLIYVLFWSMRHMHASAKVFLLSLGGVTLLALVLPDLILGGQRSRVARYLMPTYLSFHIACARCLASKLNARQPYIQWKSIVATVVVSGILSCAVSLPTQNWWHKYHSNKNVAISEHINKYPQSLLVSSDYDYNIGQLLSLSYFLTPEQQLLLFREYKEPDIVKKLADDNLINNRKMFVFNLSEPLKTKLTASGQYQLVSTSTVDKLWELTTPQ
ncbi:MAG: glycosyltransferase family 39 protein [Cyanobacteria bacterium P01_D01_bin.105]